LVINLMMAKAPIVAIVLSLLARASADRGRAAHRGSRQLRGTLLRITDLVCIDTLILWSRPMAERETNSLIGSDKVDGTAVYGTDQQKIGSVERVMIDKLSGKVAYAVISYGGFLGMGEEHYPTPWSNLKYDTKLGGYVVNLSKDQLDRAPKYANENDWQWSRDNDKRVYDYYRASPYWAA
jgi:hypothetical protein